MNRKKVAVTAVILASALAVGGVSMHANAAVKVNSYQAGKGSLVKITEINGNVVSDASSSSYAKIAGTIDRINVKVGDYVKKGDMLITYDTEDIDRRIALADYSQKEAFGGYDNIIQTGGRSAGLYSEAKTTLAELENRIAVTEATINATQKSLNDKRAAIADEGAKLQISVIDWADQPESDEYENLQKLIASNSWAQEFDPAILKMQEDLNFLNQQLASDKELRAQMVSQKATGYAGLLTQGTKEQIEAAKAANELSTDNTVAELEEAKKGVRAEFSGVVTEIGVREHETVGTGAFLFTIESAEDVVIRLNVNKYDIAEMEVGQLTTARIKNKEYTGKIKRIEHMTGRGADANVGVEVSIDEPDEDIILGLETKVRITTDSVDDVLTIPMEALFEDENGEYVFVASSEKKALRKPVETGVRNEDYVEIVSGLGDGDSVIWLDEAELTEGTVVRSE